VKSSYNGECECDDSEEAQFEQSLLTYVRKEELSTMRRDTRSLYRYPLTGDVGRHHQATTAVHTHGPASTLLDQLTCCLLCNYSTHVNCRHHHHHDTASTLFNS